MGASQLTKLRPKYVEETITLRVPSHVPTGLTLRPFPTRTGCGGGPAAASAPDGSAKDGAIAARAARSDDPQLSPLPRPQPQAAGGDTVLYVSCELSYRDQQESASVVWELRTCPRSLCHDAVPGSAVETSCAVHRANARQTCAGDERTGAEAHQGSGGRRRRGNERRWALHRTPSIRRH